MLDGIDLEPLATVIHPGGAASAFPEVVAAGEKPGGLVFEMLRRGPSGTTVSIDRLERHPHSAQTFIALSAERWLVCLVHDAADGSPDLERVRWAVAGPGDAICIHRNVWHAPLTVVSGAAEFAMIMWRIAPEMDTELRMLQAPIVLEVD